MANTFEEFKKQRSRELVNERARRFREKHKLKYFNVALSPERASLLDDKLAEKGMTKKQFLENAIDKFLESDS